MSEQLRKLEVAPIPPQQPPTARVATCPLTGVTIPECSCRRCVEELIRHHSPVLLDRRFGKSGQAGRRTA